MKRRQPSQPASPMTLTFPGFFLIHENSSRWFGVERLHTSAVSWLIVFPGNWIEILPSVNCPASPRSHVSTTVPSKTFRSIEFVWGFRRNCSSSSCLWRFGSFSFPSRNSRVARRWELFWTIRIPGTTKPEALDQQLIEISEPCCQLWIVRRLHWSAKIVYDVHFG